MLFCSTWSIEHQQFFPPSSCDGHKSAGVGYLTYCLLVTGVGFGVISVTYGAGNVAWWSGRKGMTETAGPCLFIQILIIDVS